MSPRAAAAAPPGALAAALLLLTLAACVAPTFSMCSNPVACFNNGNCLYRPEKRFVLPGQVCLGNLDLNQIPNVCGNLRPLGFVVTSCEQDPMVQGQDLVSCEHNGVVPRAVIDRTTVRPACPPYDVNIYATFCCGY